MIWNAGIKVHVGSRSDSNKSSLRGQYQHEHNHGHIINSCVKKGRRDESAPAGCLCRGFVQDTHHIKSSGRGFMRGPYHMYKQARSRARGGGARGEGREGRRGRGERGGGRGEGGASHAIYVLQNIPIRSVGEESGTPGTEKRLWQGNGHVVCAARR